MPINKAEILEKVEDFLESHDFGDRQAEADALLEQVQAWLLEDFKVEEDVD